MKIFIINLKDSAARRQNMIHQMDKIGLSYCLLEAVNGYKMTQEQLKSCLSQERSYFRELLPGEIGCFLSHYLAFKKIVDENIEYALIMEDDVTLSPRLPHLLDTLEKNIKQGDVISLYSTFPERCNLKHDSDIDNVYKLIRPEPGELVVSTVAYIISLEAAKKMVAGLLPIYNVIDDWRYWVSEGFISDFKIVFPHPIDLSDSYSDIHERNSSWQVKVKRVIVDRKFPLLSKLILKKRKKERYEARREKIFINGKNPRILYY